MNAVLPEMSSESFITLTNQPYLSIEVRNGLLCNACTGVTPLKIPQQVELSGWPDPGWSAFAIIYSGSTLLEGCKVLLINGLGFPHLLAVASRFTKDYLTTDSKWGSWTLPEAIAVHWVEVGK